METAGGFANQLNLMSAKRDCYLARSKRLTSPNQKITLTTNREMGQGVTTKLQSSKTQGHAKILRAKENAFKVGTTMRDQKQANQWHMGNIVFALPREPILNSAHSCEWGEQSHSHSPNNVCAPQPILLRHRSSFPVHSDYNMRKLEMSTFYSPEVLHSLCIHCFPPLTTAHYGDASTLNKAGALHILSSGY